MVTFTNISLETVLSVAWQWRSGIYNMIIFCAVTVSVLKLFSVVTPQKLCSQLTNPWVTSWAACKRLYPFFKESSSPVTEHKNLFDGGLWLLLQRFKKNSVSVLYNSSAILRGHISPRRKRASNYLMNDVRSRRWDVNGLIYLGDSETCHKTLLIFGCGDWRDCIMCLTSSRHRWNYS